MAVLTSPMYVRERSEWKQAEARDARRSALAGHYLARRSFARSPVICPEQAKSGPKRATGGSKRAASGAFWRDACANSAFWQTSLATACSGDPLVHSPGSPHISPR